MNLPPFTWKSCTVFMIGVIALLLAVYFLIAALLNSTPKNRLPPTPPASTALWQPGAARG